MILVVYLGHGIFFYRSSFTFLYSSVWERSTAPKLRYLNKKHVVHLYRSTRPLRCRYASEVPKGLAKHRHYVIIF